MINSSGIWKITKLLPVAIFEQINLQEKFEGQIPSRSRDNFQLMLFLCLVCYFCTGHYTSYLQMKVARNHILVVQMLHKKFRVYYSTESQQNGLHKLILIYATITCFIFSCPVQCSFKFEKCTVGSSSGHQHSVKISLPVLA